MDTPSNFPDFLLEQLYVAYLEARKGKRKTVDEHRFELNDFANIVQLQQDILSRNYKPSRGVAFIVNKPVKREIFAAPFRDRVVHHFIYNMVADWWDRRLIPDSYSCRPGKGTLYGQSRIAKHLRSVTKNYSQPAFVAKCDLTGYFMSLDRQRLFERVVWGLDRQFADNRGQLYRTLKFLWREIIFDDPTKGIKIRGTWQDWDKLPHSKSLFFQPPGQGIVIGNLTSQMLSNYYLDQLDRFVTIKLGYKHYGRYVDDFIIMVPMAQKAQLLRDLKVIQRFLRELGLNLHPQKTSCQNADKGIPFIGAVIHQGYNLPSKRLKHNCKNAFQEVATGRRDPDTVVSYLGHLKHLNSKKFLAKLFDDLGWDFEM